MVFDNYSIWLFLFQVSSVVLNNNIMHAWDFESCDSWSFADVPKTFLFGGWSMVKLRQIPEQTITYHLTFNGFELYMFQPSQNKLIEQFYIVVSDLNFHWKQRWTTRNTPLTMHYIVSTLNHPISFVRNSILFLGQETSKNDEIELRDLLRWCRCQSSFGVVQIHIAFFPEVVRIFVVLKSMRPVERLQGSVKSVFFFSSV